jgi:hypothetical protein
MTTFRRNPATMPGGLVIYPDPPVPPPPPPPPTPWHPTGHGFLYNYYAVQDARNIAPTGWEVIDAAAMNNLYAEIIQLNPVDNTPLGPGNRSGMKLKTTWDRDDEGFPGWVDPVFTNNNAQMYFTPTGIRTFNGTFQTEGRYCYIWTTETVQRIYGDFPYHLLTTSTTSRLVKNIYVIFLSTNNLLLYKRFGMSVRCYAAKTMEEENGSTGTLTDIDGNEYQYRVWGDYRYMMENLKVTKYRNGNTIPHITSDATWASTSGGAYCAYDNDNNYVGHL